MDETHIKVEDVWKYLHRAVDKEGKTVDFLLTSKRDKAVALRFFVKALPSIAQQMPDIRACLHELQRCVSALVRP